MPQFTTALAGLAVLAGIAPAAAADTWTVDPGSGALTWSVSFSDAPLPGLFHEFDAQIAFDPADLAGSHVAVTVQTASIETDGEEQTAELVKPDWFNADAFPTATFTASTFRSLGGNSYEADGTLTIRDQSHPLTLPFTFVIDGDHAQVAGGTTIDRIDYGVGQGDWAIDDVIGFDVAIQFELSATRAN